MKPESGLSAGTVCRPDALADKASDKYTAFSLSKSGLRFGVAADEHLRAHEPSEHPREQTLSIACTSGAKLHAEAELDPGSEEAPGTQLTGSSPGSQVVFRVCCEPERSRVEAISVSRAACRPEWNKLAYRCPAEVGKHCGLTEKSCLPGGSGVYFAAALLPSRLALDVSGFGRRVLHTVVRVLRSLGRLESGVRFWGGARALQVNVRTESPPSTSRMAG